MNYRQASRTGTMTLPKAHSGYLLPDSAHRENRMAVTARNVGAVLMLFVTTISVAAELTKPEPPAGISLAAMAAKAELIVLAQVRDTDYLYRREFPVSGSAFLKVLIAYKGDQTEEIIEVYEQGLHKNECYFQNPSVQEEGRRFLLFLRKDDEKENRFRGLAEGCALDVLVGKDNQYILRLPVTGIPITDELEQLAQAFEFSDAYSRETEESLSPKERDLLLQAGLITRTGEHYVYTRGVKLSEIRLLMKLEPEPGGPGNDSRP